MPKITALLAMLLLCSLSACQGAPKSASDSRLVGSWRSKNFGKHLELRFGTHRMDTITKDGMIRGHYSVSKSSAPSTLNLKTKGSEEVLTIYEFTDSGELRIQNNTPGQDRPEKFNSQSVIFEKVR